MTTERADRIMDSTRRQFLRQGFAGVGWVMAGGTLSRCSSGDGEIRSAEMSNIANLGPLLDPDENGLRLPAGFSSRVIARSGTVVEASSYVWHNAPDGGGVFITSDGGWIYVSNSETLAGLGGGVGAVRFDPDGNIIDAYRILEGTDLNCAGGHTPWGTWLSCEETETGRVWECDPLDQSAAVVRPAMGVFEHEAATVDAANRHVYLTEDVGDGRLYRFVYENAEDLSAGELQVAEVLGGGPEGAVEWRTVPDPSGVSEETRYQVPASTEFDGGEGIWLHEGVIYFATKGDNRVWTYETGTSMLTILYDAATSSTPILTGVDNLTVTPAGDVVVGEDGGDMQVVAISAEGPIVPIVQITGQDGSEVTGPVFGPSLQ
ncbi:MAG: PhoX family protein, partial [Gemmatimonadetes bacterium]|nr:PhoX family protein [Gemmatimonadota bacterium]